MQAIRDLGIADNTLVVWTTDNGAWIDAWPDAGYTPFRGMKGTPFEGGFRVPASPGGRAISSLARQHGHMVPHGLVAHFRRLAGLEPPPHEWKDNNGNSIIFDGIDLSDSLLGNGPGKREDFFYFNDQEFGGLRVKNYKMLFTAKDSWIGPEAAAQASRPSTTSGGTLASSTT